MISRCCHNFPVTTNELRWRGENLLLSEKKKWTPPKGGVLKIRMLTLPHDIEIPLAELSNGKHEPGVGIRALAAVPSIQPALARN
jgi:hypothetical protein